MAALREVLKQQALAQHGIGRFGQRMSLARAEVAMLAEEGRHHAVGRRIELEHGLEQLGREVQQGIRMHGIDYPARSSCVESSATCVRGRGCWAPSRSVPCWPLRCRRASQA